MRYASLSDAIRADVGRAIVMATGGALAFAPIEYALTLWTYAGGTTIGSKLDLAALTITLSVWLWFLLAAGLAATMVIDRAVRAQFDPATAGDPGWFALSPLQGGVRRGVPRLWATVMTALSIGVGLQRSAVQVIEHYQEPQLKGIVIAAIALVWFAIGLRLRRMLVVAMDTAADALAPVLRVANPLGRWRAAGIAIAVVIAGGLATCWFALPQSRSVLPMRLTASAIVIGFGMGFGAKYAAERRRRGPRKKLHALALAGGALAFMTATLVWWGAVLEAKYVAITASPALDKLIGVVRFANDIDRDGFGSLLGEGDCAPFDPTIYPGATDVPDDGIDQNCDGHDFSLKDIAVNSGQVKEVPPQFKKEWNVLFITIDTLRYDHTTFGGYAESAKHRDTTPRLAELVKHSVSFTFTNAPSAGTMASIPAILTSKYFHSGIALDENRPPGTPPGILPENTTLPEIMKRKGYRTGVVSSHAWWNGWGFEQGVDDYDNSIAPTDDPYRIAADRVTDHVLAWVSRNQGHKWFMWAHYIDPHGRYMAHPDVVDYGSSEPDLYDAEIKWTDQEVGRLLDELSRLPSYGNTIVIITSDHGDSMGEHTVPVGTHGTALYRELQHVPMVFYIPDNKPRLVPGAVSNLDIVPTIAQLCDIDVHDLSFEGRSLVPQLFYDHTEDHERIVFAETNAPQKQRAAISESWKLIHYFSSNVDELYDLKADPWEHTNLAPTDPPAYTVMKAALQQWLDRVMYARDPKFNQAFRQISDVTLSAAPTPQVATHGQSIGGIEILGIGVDGQKPLVPGAKVDVFVYFHVTTPTKTAYRFLLSAWPVDREAPLTDAAPATMYRSPLRATADGAFATDHWKAGDYIRERFPVTLGTDWHATGVAIGLVTVDPTGNKVKATGAAPANDQDTAVLGVLGAGSSAPAHP